jgi:iron complex outermembrane recepter protein
MKLINIRIGLAVRVTIAAGIAPSLALAQTTDTDTQRGLELEQITVTAQKIAQSAQVVPVAISAFTADELESHQAFNLEDLKYLVPNLYLEQNLSNSGTPKIFMRGIGQANSAFSFDSPIGIYVDDVYYAKEVGSLVDFVDVDRIEVLRGPQGTIYGRNSSIGAVRVVTKSAPLEDTDIKGDVTFGSNDQRNARVTLGVPIITDEVGLRVSFNSKYNSGFETNTVNGERADSDDSNAARLQLLTKFSDNLSLTIRGDYLRDDSRPPVAIDYNTGNLSSLQYQSELFYSTGTARSRLETFGSSATLDWSFDDAKLTSISAWRGVNTVNAFDSDGTTAASFEVPHSDLDDRSLTQEIFVSGQHLAGLPIDWVGGVFLLHEQTDYLWSLQIFAPPSAQNFEQQVNSAAGYFQGTWHVTDKLGITGGSRYTAEHKDFGVISHLADGSFDFAYSNHDLNTDRWTWRGAANYQLDQPVMLYTSVETGFRSGGLNGNAQTLQDVTGGAFQPEDTLMYEAGVKSEFWEHRLRLNADYYYGRYEHLQEAVVLQDGAVSNINNTAHVNGLELDARVLPFAGMEVSATVGTLQDTIQGSNTVLPDAPHLTWNLAADYSHELAAYGVGTLGVSYGHTGSSFEDAANTPILEVHEHDNVDAHATFAMRDDHWQFTFAGYNLTNKIYAIGGFDIAGGLISSTEWPSLPRRWTLRAQYKY